MDLLLKCFITGFISLVQGFSDELLPGEMSSSRFEADDWLSHDEPSQEHLENNYKCPWPNFCFFNYCKNANKTASSFEQKR